MCFINKTKNRKLDSSSIVERDSKVYKIQSHPEYLKEFAHLSHEEKKEVIKIILDTRKFEIELYWKRSTYYWTLIGAIFVGYFTTYAHFDDEPRKLEILYFLNCLGLLFSVGWYFVNRGSKFWQMNWEKHAEALETDIIGPLFKMTISDKEYSSNKKLINLFAPFPFSVSKINQILNLVVIVFWLTVLVSNSIENLEISSDVFKHVYIYILIFTVIGFWALLFKGRSNKKDRDGEIKRTAINFDKRGITDHD